MTGAVAAQYPFQGFAQEHGDCNRQAAVEHESQAGGEAPVKRGRAHIGETGQQRQVEKVVIGQKA